MQILNVGILGVGTMGKQIALLCASHGIPVVLWGHNCNPGFEKEFNRIIQIQTKLGTLCKDVAENIHGNIKYVNDILELKGCDILIEAVTEDIRIKSAVLREIGAILDDCRMVASNTSTLSITLLASFLPDPSRFIGVHFFNPPMSMKLVEVIKGEHTSDNTVTNAIELLNVLKKNPVVLPETPGFVVNRLLFPMINEAIFLLADGISDAKTIDCCMKMGANHPMGPLELADLIGLDVCLSILETLVAETGDGKYRPAPLLKKYVRAGKLGKKTGSGFYVYRKKG
jgi:3-hydroxybutyryl-CoA dehydrogenase